MPSTIMGAKVKKRRLNDSSSSFDTMLSQEMSFEASVDLPTREISPTHSDGNLCGMKFAVKRGREGTHNLIQTLC